MAAALLVAAIGWPEAATASSAEEAVASSAVTSLAWGVVPTATSVASAPPCLTSPASCGAFTSSGSSPWYLDIWNTGTATLTGLSYVISFQGGIGPTVTLVACSVAWTISLLTSCSGTETTILSSVAAGTYGTAVGVPANPGGEVYLQATPAGLPSSLTISTSVTSGTPRQVRAATTTNA